MTKETIERFQSQKQGRVLTVVYIYKDSIIRELGLLELFYYSSFTTRLKLREMDTVTRAILFLVVACCVTADVINVKDCGMLLPSTFSYTYHLIILLLFFFCINLL